jgi:prophage maintenance system killer protein
LVGLDSYRIEAPETEVVTVMLALAAGKLDEEELAAWLRASRREAMRKGRLALPRFSGA